MFFINDILKNQHIITLRYNEKLNIFLYNIIFYKIIFKNGYI